MCFFFNDPAPTHIYTLSLHDALPISLRLGQSLAGEACRTAGNVTLTHTTDIVCGDKAAASGRSEEHTSELQSLTNLVCRLLLEKKNKTERSRSRRTTTRTRSATTAS